MRVERSIHHLPPILRLSGRQRRLQGNAGSVDQDVQPTPVVGSKRDALFHGDEPGEIRLHHLHLSAPLTNALGRFLEPVPAPGADCHPDSGRAQG